MDHQLPRLLREQTLPEFAGFSAVRAQRSFPTAVGWFSTDRDPEVPEQPYVGTSL
jgi:hypothetical protein